MATLITGGAGFIGSHLADRLITRGETVHVIDDLSTGSLDNIRHLLGDARFHFHTGSINDPALVAELVHTCETVYHLAAAVGVKRIMADSIGAIETNVRGAAAVISACAAARRRLLFTSSSEVYGRTGTSDPLAEDHDAVLGPTNVPRWSYACTKMLGEFLALAHRRENGLSVVIVRLFNVIGPRQVGSYGMVVPTFVGQALRGEPITVYGDGKQTRTFVHVTDVVQALVALMDRPDSAGGIFNVGGDHETTVEELARLVKQTTGSSSPIVHVPYLQAYGEGFEDMERRVPDLRKIREAIGYVPRVPLDEAIRDIAGSYVEKSDS